MLVQNPALILSEEESAKLRYIIAHFDDMNRDRIKAELTKLLASAEGPKTVLC